MLTMTRRRTSFRIVPPRYKVPTKKELREARIAGFQAIAEQLGLRWGGIAGGVATVVLRRRAMPAQRAKQYRVLADDVEATERGRG